MCIRGGLLGRIYAVEHTKDILCAIKELLIDARYVLPLAHKFMRPDYLTQHLTAPFLEGDEMREPATVKVQAKNFVAHDRVNPKDLGHKILVLLRSTLSAAQVTDFALPEP